MRVRHFDEKSRIYDLGGAFERKNLYIRSRVQHFGKKGCIYALGRKVPTLFREKGNIRLGSEKSENMSVRLANFFVYS